MALDTRAGVGAPSHSSTMFPLWSKVKLLITELEVLLADEVFLDPFWGKRTGGGCVV